MIIGKGSIAKLLNDREGFLFFASGVSDSSIGCETNRNEATQREGKMLFNWLASANTEKLMLVYFSTISKFHNETFYILHKRKMEVMIRELGENYTILNLGNVWECTNPNTFINAYKRQPYEPRDEWKYMISKKQLNFITDNLPRTGQHEISVFGEMLKAAQCVKNTEYL